MIRQCDVCQMEYEAKSPKSEVCGDTCRKRKARGATVTKTDAPVERGLVEAVKRELEAAGRLDSMLGQSAVLLAEQMCSNRVALGSAALNKELRATMVAAVQGASVADDAVDEVKKKRDEIRRRRAG